MLFATVFMLYLANIWFVLVNISSICSHTFHTCMGWGPKNLGGVIDNFLIEKLYVKIDQPHYLSWICHSHMNVFFDLSMSGHGKLPWLKTIVKCHVRRRSLVAERLSSKQEIMGSIPIGAYFTLLPKRVINKLARIFSLLAEIVYFKTKVGNHIILCTKVVADFIWCLPPSITLKRWWFVLYMYYPYPPVYFDPPQKLSDPSFEKWLTP